MRHNFLNNTSKKEIIVTLMKILRRHAVNGQITNVSVLIVVVFRLGNDFYTILYLFVAFAFSTNLLAFKHFISTARTQLRVWCRRTKAQR